MTAPLFPEPPHESRALARAADPLTSHQAADHMAKSGRLGQMMARTLHLLREYPGRTAAELERIACVADGRYRKRLNDLRLAGRARKGDSRKCRVTGRKAATWTAT